MAICSALDIQTILKKKNFFAPLNILQKVEQGPLYKMDRKFKANWKLTIGWGIFYMQFSF